MSLRDSLRILVVDDMSTSRGLITQALEAAGIRNIVVADSARQAMGIMAANPVHLVISDYNMPEIDGLQFLEAVRRNPSTQRTGFIIVSGRIEPAMIQKGQALGLNNLIAKPFSNQDMLSCVEKVVGRV
jgi:two-component system, chemotaxis family, chemotaxis protein CheY